MESINDSLKKVAQAKGLIKAFLELGNKKLLKTALDILEETEEALANQR